MADLGFPVFDGDNHLYEPPAALLEHLPPARRRDVQFVDVNGRTRIALRGHITDYIPNPTFERIGRPGSLGAFYRGDNPEGRTRREMLGEAIDCPPSFRLPEPRLGLLDEQGVAQALVFPTLANLVEHNLADDPELTHEVIHALNRWLDEVWTFDYRHRLFAVPVVTLGLVEPAVTELEWLLGRGARAVLIRPAPPTGWRGSRSFGLAEFDPFWARVQEADIPVCLHQTQSVVSGYVDLWEPPSQANAFASSAFRILGLGHRDIQDSLTSLICHGTLSRFPGLKIYSVENGSDWIGYLAAGLARVHRQMPQDFAEHPLDVLRRNVWVNPFWEEPLADLLEHVGVGHVVFGSDYPHVEGMEEPLAYAAHLERLGCAPSARRIMHDNLTGLLGAG